jgi:hypothetical protein
MTTTYLHGITDRAVHRVSTRRTRRHRHGLVLHTVTADRWFPGDRVLMFGEDGTALTAEAEVADVEVTTGQVVLTPDA